MSHTDHACILFHIRSDHAQIQTEIPDVCKSSKYQLHASFTTMRFCCFLKSHFYVPQELFLNSWNQYFHNKCNHSNSITEVILRTLRVCAEYIICHVILTLLFLPFGAVRPGLDSQIRSGRHRQKAILRLYFCHKWTRCYQFTNL